MELEPGSVGAVGAPPRDGEVAGSGVEDGKHVGDGMPPLDESEIRALLAAGGLAVGDGGAIGAEHRQQGGAHEHVGAGLAVEQAGADDEVVLADAGGVGEHPSGIGRNQEIEVGHGPVAPEKRLVGAGRHVGVADDPRPVVDGPGPGIVGRPAQNPEIPHQQIDGAFGALVRRLPGSVGGGDEKGVVGIPIVGDAGPADRLADVVEVLRGAVFAAVRGQGPEQLHFAGIMGAIAIVVEPDKAPIAGTGHVEEGDAADAPLLVDGRSFAPLVGPDVMGRDLDELVAAPRKGGVVGRGGGKLRRPREGEPVVDARAPAVRAAKGAQVHQAVADEEERVIIGGRHVGVACDLALVVDGVGHAGGAAGQEAQSRHGAILPQESLGPALLVLRPADDLAEVVDAARHAGGPAQGAEIDHAVFGGGGNGAGQQRDRPKRSEDPSAPEEGGSERVHAANPRRDPGARIRDRAESEGDHSVRTPKKRWSGGRGGEVMTGGVATRLVNRMNPSTRLDVEST